MKDDRWKEIPELIVIEDMKTEDIEEVAQLEKEIFSIPWSSQGFLSSLRQPDTLYLTVRAGGRLVG